MRIASIVRVSTQGVSRPYVCQDESGGLWWCKGSHTGLRAVMSEWVCANVARAVGLSVPDFAIARFEPNEFRQWNVDHGGRYPLLVTETNPYVFASRHVESAKDVICAARDLRNTDDLTLAKVYLFDAFVRNTDRTHYNSNLLINGVMHIIDHGNAFDSAFERATFEREHILRESLARVSAGEVSTFEQVLRDTVSPSFLDAVWSEMPAQWTDTGEDVFSLRMVKTALLENAR